LVDGYAVAEHPLYVTWVDMLSRTRNPNAVGYENYGGRGIGVSKEWEHFENFAKDMGEKSSNLTLERIDNSKGYSKENCKWDTRSNQCLNRRLFKNNSSGARGVVKTKSGFHARFDYEQRRYSIGWFETKGEAERARSEFIDMFFDNKEKSLSLLSINKPRSTNSVGERGINPHSKGGFIVRLVVEKKRRYIGWFKTLEEAIIAKQKFLDSRTK